MNKQGKEGQNDGGFPAHYSHFSHGCPDAAKKPAGTRVPAGRSADHRIRP
jgi:hypothetical protein